MFIGTTVGFGFLCLVLCGYIFIKSLSNTYKARFNISSALVNKQINDLYKYVFEGESFDFDYYLCL